ncbi:DMT family transporter [Profundibacterium mesophilum]|uniref:EamA-like transporter family domain containing protein n=1 Tax=Profundibacterium mesophilum KAUST100406-0324 TaxID=1037889 RepID=A0A921NRI4_9RHOB|nr:DMT family transporter [Profundibacterium mesophilum]KAF0676415.1 EamA-like transporter family domain containing protein [Profundibacterium mesophilum KAUST100406-0324]
MDIKAILMGLAFAFMWSSAFTSARIIVAEAPPLSALALRFAISGTLGIMLALALGQSWKLSRAQWKATVIFGICQNALYLGLNFVAMQTVEAGLAAIIASSMPLLVALAGTLFYNERISGLAAAGLAAGLLGVALIMGSRLSGGVDLGGLLLCGIGVLALTFATLSVRSASSGGNLMMVVGLQMVIGSAALTLVAIPLETWDVTWSTRLTFAFVYTTLVPGLAATFVWFLLVERIGAVRAATFHFLNPFLGVAIAAVFLGERLGIFDLIGVTIIMFGILAVQLSRHADAGHKGGSRQKGRRIAAAIRRGKG